MRSFDAFFLLYYALIWCWTLHRSTVQQGLSPVTSYAVVRRNEMCLPPCVLPTLPRLPNFTFCWRSVWSPDLYYKVGKLPDLSGISDKSWVFSWIFLKKRVFLRKIQKFLIKNYDLFPTLLLVVDMWLTFENTLSFVTDRTGIAGISLASSAKFGRWYDLSSTTRDVFHLKSPIRSRKRVSKLPLFFWGVPLQHPWW